MPLLTTLVELVGGLLSHLAGGRANADGATVQLAELYRRHPLLQLFPVPRSQISEATFDLKFAIAEAPEAVVTLTPELRERLVGRLSALARGLVRNPLMPTALRDRADLDDAWAREWAARGPKLDDLIPASGSFDLHDASGRWADGLIELMQSCVTSTAGADGLGAFDHEARLRLHGEVAFGMVAAYQELRGQPPTGLPGNLKILVTAEDLEPIAPDRINTVQIKLTPSDRSWSVQEQDGHELTRLHAD